MLRNVYIRINICFTHSLLNNKIFINTTFIWVFNVGVEKEIVEFLYYVEIYCI